MEKRTDHVKKEKLHGRGLLDSVFSWSLQDVLNKDLYKDKVEKIPESFMSTTDYMKAFMKPLLAETHADLFSSIESLAGQPTCRVLNVRKSKNYKTSTDLFYEISVGRTRGRYVPGVGDLIALTNLKPNFVDDLIRTQQSYLIAFVHAMKGENNPTYSLLASKPILDEEDWQMGAVCAVHLINLTTNLRIWKALNLELEGKNMSIIKKVLQSDSTDGENCSICSRGDNRRVVSACMRDKLQSFNLNTSQEAAILSCIDTVGCRHQYTVKLIQGPPGTGKTKTVSSLLSTLLKMKCRTLTCAPTNVAVLEVAGRVLRTVVDAVGYETYGMGDMVLFGNRERMKIEDDQNDLLHMFLDHRANILEKCFDASSGWNSSLASMMCLLEDSEAQYCLYLLDDTAEEDPFTFERFVWKRFKFVREQLTFCMVNLYTHLPTTFISLEVTKNMIKAIELMRSLESLLLSVAVANEEGLKQVIKEYDDVGSRFHNHIKLRNAKKECLSILSLLHGKLEALNFSDRFAIEKFCLSNACLLFCTTSSSAKLHSKGFAPLHLLVIDEAAQLRECESTIPLQLSGLRHAILIGDERQLSATVNSKISEEAEFGRSLFERLAKSGCKTHFLNIQYRMHPSISLFPNKEFYGRQIMDAPNVKEMAYKRQFLKGKMFESYSFINIAHGKEEFVDQRSFKNVVEAAVVADIVERLFKEFVRTKKKVSIGIISPYGAQVNAIRQKISKFVSDSDSAFSVSVGTVDGFQGGEEDLVIVSTVRSNKKGSVGFVSNPQRANVALTRARYCLWILGNEATLTMSSSIWKKLVNDAKERQFFYHAEDDKSLAQAITAALINLDQLDVLLKTDSILFHKAKWRVCFSGDFQRSMFRIKNTKICEDVLSLLAKLATGWRRHPKKRSLVIHHGISSSLLEQYEASGHLIMVWTVDILQENSFYIQVLKVWDILASSDIPKLAMHLDTIFGNYTEELMNCCLYKCREGNLVVPMRWPVNSCSVSQGSCSEADTMHLPKSQNSQNSQNLKDEFSSTPKAPKKQWKSK